MTKLIVTRGLPGSGKTTWARQQPDCWRVNRDELRAMFTPTWPWGDDEHESLCTAVQYQAIRALLVRDRDVIVDDTNLRVEHLLALESIARTARDEVLPQWLYAGNDEDLRALAALVAEITEMAIRRAKAGDRP